MNKKIAIIIVIIVISLATASTVLIKNSSLIQSPPIPTPTPTPNEIFVPNPPEGLPDELINLAKKDLAQNLNIDESEISVTKVEKKEWPNASLGCPKPGKFYAQVVTPGFLLTLTAQEQTYTYHTSLKEITTCD